MRGGCGCQSWTMTSRILHWKLFVYEQTGWLWPVLFLPIPGAGLWSCPRCWKWTKHWPTLQLAFIAIFKIRHGHIALKAVNVLLKFYFFKKTKEFTLVFRNEWKSAFLLYLSKSAAFVVEVFVCSTFKRAHCKFDPDSLRACDRLTEIVGNYVKEKPVNFTKLERTANSSKTLLS